MSTVKTFSFDQDSFRSLFAFAGDLSPGYHDFGETKFDEMISEMEAEGFPDEAIDSISETANGLIEFLQEAIPSGDRDLDKLMGVKVGVSGAIERFYTPAVFRDGDDLVLQIGKNKTLLHQNGETVAVGELQGKIKLTGAKTEDGTEYCIIAIRFKNEAGDRFYVIRAINDPDNSYSESCLELALDNGESLAPYLRQIGSGGSSFVKLRDLDEDTDYPLSGVVEPPNLRYGRFELVLSDGRQVAPNRALHTQIEGFATAFDDNIDKVSKFYNGRILRILAKEYRGGKCFVTAKIVKGGDNGLSGKTKDNRSSDKPKQLTSTNGSANDEYAGIPL